jgi:hypothetical protein
MVKRYMTQKQIDRIQKVEIADLHKADREVRRALIDIKKEQGHRFYSRKQKEALKLKRDFIRSSRPKNSPTHADYLAYLKSIQHAKKVIKKPAKTPGAKKEKKAQVKRTIKKIIEKAQEAHTEIEKPLDIDMTEEETLAWISKLPKRTAEHLTPFGKLRRMEERQLDEIEQDKHRAWAGQNTATDRRRLVRIFNREKAIKRAEGRIKWTTT